MIPWKKDTRIEGQPKLLKAIGCAIIRWVFGTVVDDGVAGDCEVGVAEEIGHEGAHSEFFGGGSFLTCFCHFDVGEGDFAEGFADFIRHEKKGMFGLT